MMPYCNNLKMGDPVLDVVRSRKGTVAAQPRESSTNVQIEFEGNTAAIYVPIRQLRLIVDGQPEDVPPHDGELPAAAPRATGPRPAKPVVVAAGTDVTKPLHERRAYLKGVMEEMNKEFAAMRAEVETLDKALALLEGQP